MFYEILHQGFQHLQFSSIVYYFSNDFTILNQETCESYYFSVEIVVILDSKPIKALIACLTEPNVRLPR